MSDFINTIDVLGDDAAVDSVITKSVTEFYDNVVTKIGRGVFYKCSSLTTVNLPAVTSVGSDAFYGCDALINVNLPLATTIGGTAFDNVVSLTRITLPSATSIGSQAFRACTALNTVELNSKTSIGEYAFNNASALKVLALRSTAGASTLSYTNAFNGTPIASGTGYIYVPFSLLSSYKTATNWSTYADQFRKLEEWTVDGTVTGELDVDNRCMVRFFNDDGTLLGYKVVAHGGTTTYDGTPVCSEDSSWAFKGFEPVPTNVTEDMDCYAQYEMPFCLETASWAEISEISAAGTGANYFSVGESKSLYLSGKVGTSGINLDDTYEVFILGFDHNSELEGRGIHFGCFRKDGADVELIRYTGTSMNGSKGLNMYHSSTTNSNGWKGCDLRYDILGSTHARGVDAADTCATSPIANTLMACLPEDLRVVMKPITKWTDNSGGTVSTDSYVTASVDYLPLMSEFEIFGIRTYANTYEQNHQQQYQYYKDGNSPARMSYANPTVAADAHFTRSPSKNDSYSYVAAAAKAYSVSASQRQGIAPIFMV